MGNKEEALIDYNNAIQLDPLDAITYINRGIFWYYIIGILYKDIGNKD